MKFICKNILFIGLIIPFLFSMAFASEDIPSKKTLRFGILPDSSSSIIESRFEPLIKYLKREANIEIDSVIPKDYQDLINLFKNKKIDLAFFGGYTFIKAQIEANAEPFVMRDIDLRFSSFFLVHPDNIKTKLDEFKGSTLSFGSRLSTSGHLMPRYFLTEQHINPETFFAKVLYSGNHDKTALWVRDGKVDLGAANSTVIRKMLKDGLLNPTDIRILWETPAYSDYVLAIQPHFDPILRAHLLDLFLSLSPTDPEQRNILDVLGTNGFLPANNADFDLLKKLVQRLERDIK